MIAVDDRYQSGLSDMLAAFPPPVQTRRQSRSSWLRASQAWPLGANRDRTSQRVSAAGKGRAMESATPSPRTPDSDESSIKRGRRCCGLPLWGFILIILIVIGVVAAAILVPLEFFVFRKLNNTVTTNGPSLEQCRQQLTCSNGGTNIVDQGVCSCICTNGFAGSNCTIGGGAGCTTTNLVTAGASAPTISNVTLGQAVPRLIAQAQSNFSIPLSATSILAKFNSADLSCIAQNSLVTFDGRSTRTGRMSDQVFGESTDDSSVRQGAFVSVSIITLVPGQTTTVTFKNAASDDGIAPTAVAGAGFPSVINAPISISTIFATTATFRATIFPNPTGTVTTTVTTTIPRPAPTATFVVTEAVLDFARVAMLFILQEESVQSANTAQTMLQKFFSTATQNTQGASASVLMAQAMNVSLGNGNSINLGQFLVDIGTGPVGGRLAKRDLEPESQYQHPHFRLRGTGDNGT